MIAPLHSALILPLEMQIQKVNVLGVEISVLDQERAREFLFAAVREGKRGYVTVTGVHGVSEAQEDAELKRILNGSFLCTPDGMPMVWMGRLQGHHSIRRVYGPDLMLNLCEHSRQAGLTHFFYGGIPGVAEELKEVLERKYPGLQVVGTYCPPFRLLNANEMEEVRARVRETRPDFFWVGLSTPKQERFMAANLFLLPEAGIFIGVGAAFDLLTGRIRQAPRWMQRLGLEWLFRVTQEPKRLWKRYFVNNPLFVLRACGQLLGLRKYLRE